MKAKRFFGLLVAAALVFALLPILAQAASNPLTYTFDVSESWIDIDIGTNPGTLKVTYGYPISEELDNIPSSQPITIIGTTALYGVTVWDGVTANITLSNVSISSSPVGYCVFELQGTANVTLTLTGSNSLTSGGQCAGLEVPENAMLTIGGTGSLTAIGGGSGSVGGAGIGGSSDDGGTIIINGGTVTTNGTNGGAGIGGGRDGNGGNITINGGTITANGGASDFGGAGIGGGGGGTNGDTVITGGSVKASGADYDIQGTPTNGIENGGATVSLVTAELPGANGEEVTGLVLSGASYYGTDDLFTDADGKLYLWLPSGGEVVQARTATTIFNSVSGALVADTAAPAVTGVTPSDAGAAASGDIVVTFGEEMRPGIGAVSLDGGATALTGGNWNTTKTVYTIPYSGLDIGTTYTVTISGFADYSGNVMALDASHTFTTAPGFGNDGGSDNTPVSRILTSNNTGITISGSISPDAQLTIGDMALGSGSAHNTIRKWVNNKNYIFLAGRDISLSGSFTGELTISIPVGAQYNGQSVTVLHAKKDGMLATYTVKVADGKVMFKVTSLSPFAVFASASGVEPPQTGGGNMLPAGLGLLALGILGVLLALRRRSRHA